MTQEEKAKRYDESIKRGLDYIRQTPATEMVTRQSILEHIFPELKESEDDRMIQYFKDLAPFDKADELYEKYGFSHKDALAWLEKQGEKNKWKPSKDEMDALYGLSYITNKMDDKKDEAITKLYQDLKREFFDGASYENMFPSSPVDAPIKDEKQGEQKPIISNNALREGIAHFGITQYQIDNWLKKYVDIEKQGEQKPADKIEPKFCVGDIMRTLQEATNGVIDGLPVVISIDNGYYRCNNEVIAIKDQDNYEYPPMNRRQKPAWSEEDEKILSDIIKDLAHPWNEYIPDRIEDEIKWLKNRLKSLRPQNTWKPSDEQMNALEHFVRSIGESGYASPYDNDTKLLYSLLFDLKKLREE